MSSHNSSDSHGNPSSDNHGHSHQDRGLGWDFYSKRIWNKSSSALGGSTKPGFPHYGSAVTYREPADLLEMDNELMENNPSLLDKIGWANGSTMNDVAVRPYMVKVPNGNVEFRYGVDLGWYDITEQNQSIEMVHKPKWPNRMALIGEDKGILNNDNLVYHGDMNAAGRYFSRIETLRSDLRRYVTEDDYTTNGRAQRFKDSLNSHELYPATELKAISAIGDDEFIAATIPELGVLMRGHPYTDANREAAEQLGIKTKDFKARALDEEIGHMHGFYKKGVVENETEVRAFLSGFYRSEAARFKHSNPEYARTMDRLAGIVEAEAKHITETNRYGDNEGSDHSLEHFISELYEKIQAYEEACGCDEDKSKNEGHGEGHYRQANGSVRKFWNEDAESEETDGEDSDGNEGSDGGEGCDDGGCEGGE